MREIIDRPSPNFDERKLPVSMIVVHYTETKTCEQALRILCDPNAAKRVSSHWVIDRDGTVYRLVDESKRAWHAGKSFWDGIEDCNSASIGIELVNDGAEEYPEPQLAALVAIDFDTLRRGLAADDAADAARRRIADVRDAVHALGGQRHDGLDDAGGYCHSV